MFSYFVIVKLQFYIYKKIIHSVVQPTNVKIVFGIKLFCRCCCHCYIIHLRIEENPMTGYIRFIRSLSLLTEIWAGNTSHLCYNVIYCCKTLSVKIKQSINIISGIFIFTVNLKYNSPQLHFQFSYAYVVKNRPHPSKELLQVGAYTTQKISYW